MAMLDGDDKGIAANLVTMEDQQELQYIESRLNDIIICNDALSHATTLLNELYGCYKYYVARDQAEGSKDALYYDSISSSLRQKAEEITYTKRKTETLLSKTQSSKGLVRSLTAWYLV